MKGRQFSLFRSSILITLMGVFLYSASVQEIHYLFVNHSAELSEHCHNHLHNQTNHVECNLCKIELSSYVTSFQQFDSSVKLFSAGPNVYLVQDIQVLFSLSSVSPRGPPVLA